MDAARREREEMWGASVRRDRERRRRKIRAEWYGFFCRMADALRARAAEYDERAEALMEEEGKGA